MKNSDTSPISQLQQPVIEGTGHFYKPSHASRVNMESVTECVSTSLSLNMTNHNNDESPPAYCLIVHPPLFTGNPLADVPSNNIIDETCIHNEIVFVRHIKCAIVDEFVSFNWISNAHPYLLLVPEDPWLFPIFSCLNMVLNLGAIPRS